MQKGERPSYTCGLHSHCGGNVCTTHSIKQYLLETTVLADIQAKRRMVLYEADAREKFLAYKSKQNATRSAEEKKREMAVRNRLDELAKLIQNIYEDKVLGRVPEDVCIGLLEKYSAEKKSLSVEYAAILERETAMKQDEADVDEFISSLKKYAGAEELTREMCIAHAVIPIHNIIFHQSDFIVRSVNIFYLAVKRSSKLFAACTVDLDTLIQTVTCLIPTCHFITKLSFQRVVTNGIT